MKYDELINKSKIRYYKNLFLFLMVMTVSFLVNGQSLIGAWELNTTSENGEKIRNVVIFTEGHQVSTWFKSETGEFISSNGGSWKIEGDNMIEKVEFDTKTAERVGSVVTFKIEMTGTSLSIVGGNLKWLRIDNGAPGKLQGAWLMSGRIRNDELRQRNTSRPRKTMKILSGTRFQWIAYNTETKQFMGTGGGTYTTVNGKYTENIEFFSRDTSKTGRSLEFNYALVDGKWEHTGFSSKGDALYEIWSLRN